MKMVNKLFKGNSEIWLAEKFIPERVLTLLNVDFEKRVKVKIQAPPNSTVYTAEQPGPDVQWIQADDPLFPMVLDEFNRAFLKFVKATGREVSVTQIETPRYNLYIPGIGYNEHIDKTSLNPVISKRYVSVVVGLNDDYEGGLLSFPRQGIELKIGRGDVAIFPAGYTHPHGVTPVTKGERKTIVAWFG